RSFHLFYSLYDGPEAFTLVATVLHSLAPLLVIEIPLHCFADARLKGFLRCPAKLPLNLAGVNGIAQIMAGAILHVGDQCAVRAAVWSWAELIQQAAESVYHLDIQLFVMPADVIGFTHLSFGHDSIECTGMVFHVEPVAHLRARTVNRQTFAFKGIENHQWNTFFRKLAGAVVITAVGNQDWQTLSAIPSTD